MGEMTNPRTLWAISDLHVTSPGNRELVDRHVHPRHPQDWLIVAGDIAERTETVRDILADLASRFEKVIFAPGNHEVYGYADVEGGRAKYDAIIAAARQLGVVTPEDPYVSFAGRTIAPLFTLYDYSWRPEGTTPGEALAAAERSGVVLTDHYAIAPFVDIPMWCRERLRDAVSRLAQVNEPVIFVNHWPLARDITTELIWPEIALWSGTRHTQTWPQRYGAEAVVYGHLHLPGVRSIDGIPHIEASLGYPREWSRTLEDRLAAGQWPYPVLTAEVVP